MTAKIINGKEIAEDIISKISVKIEALSKKNKVPGLAVIYIGNDKASEVYADMIIKKSRKIGFNSHKYIFPENVEDVEVFKLIEKLNNDREVNGVIIQFPVPNNIDESRLKLKLNPLKDVDCVNPINVGKMYTGLPTYLPCTPKGAVKLLKTLGLDLTGKSATVIGRSNIVGKPVAELLLRENLTVTICHSKTTNLDEYLINSDVIVAAVGRPEIIKGEYIKEGAIVIDIGTNVVDGRLVGDVEYNKAVEKASYITPVPGGVGPMTIAMLLENTLEASIKQWELEL